MRFGNVFWLVSLSLASSGLTAGCAQPTELVRRDVAPEVQILQPVQGATVSAAGGVVSLVGFAEDNLDDPEQLSATWRLMGQDFTAVIDENGGITGAVDPGFVTPGQQRLTLLVTDQDGATGSDEVSFVIEPTAGAPRVEILSPASGSRFTEGDAIEFEGLAEDTGTPADMLAFRWLSDIDGILPGAATVDGRSTLSVSQLAIGNHLITLEVTDTDGEVGVDQIEVNVDPIPAEEGDLVFSEMMINPQVVPDDQGEWVELWNATERIIDVSGYSFHDDDVDIYVLNGPLYVVPGDYLVLCANMDPAMNGGVNCDGLFERVWSGGGLALANLPDEVVLSRPDGVEIDWVHYDQTWFQPAVAIGVDPRYMNSGDNDNRDHWCSQTTVIATGGEPGTPGRPNDPC